MKDAARKLLDSPSVHEATGVAQAQAHEALRAGQGIVRRRARSATACGTRWVTRTRSTVPRRRPAPAHVVEQLLGQLPGPSVKDGPMTWFAPEDNPPPAADKRRTEREMLQAWLDFHRDTLLLKCAGLTAEQLASASVEPSNLTLLGLVRHMAGSSAEWFRQTAAGLDIDDLFCDRGRARRRPRHDRSGRRRGRLRHVRRGVPTRRRRGRRAST